MAKQCPTCFKQIHDKSTVCPYCRHVFGEGGDADKEPSSQGMSASKRASRRSRGTAARRASSKKGGGFGKVILWLIIIGAVGFGLNVYLNRFPEFWELKTKTIDKAETFIHQKMTGGTKEPDEEAVFARVICISLLDSDEETYVRLHLTKGDMTPDGRGILVTDFGGIEPDDLWTQNVKNSYVDARKQVEGLEESVGKLSCGGLLNTQGRVKKLDEYIKAMFIEIHTNDVRYVVHTGSSRLSQRGRILVGDPSLSFLLWKDYRKKFPE